MRSRRRLSMRSRSAVWVTRTLWVLGIPGLLLGCRDLLVDPAPAEPAALRVALVLPEPASLSSSPVPTRSLFETAPAAVGQVFDQGDAIRIRIRRASGSVEEETRNFQSNGSETRIRLELDLESRTEAVTVEFALLSQGRLLFQGSGGVTLRRGEGTEAEIQLQPVPAGVVVSGGPIRLDALGAEQTLTGSVVFATGDPIPGLPVTWVSSNGQVAEIVGGTRVRARAEGEAQVTARHEGLSATVQVIVRQAVARVTVTPASAERVVGERIRFQAALADRNGNPISGGARPIAWSTSNATVAQVDTTGEAFAMSAGRAVLSAASEGVSGSATLEVRAPALPPEITTSSVPNGLVGRAYSVDLRATGGLAPLVWTIGSGSLPGGLSLSGAGRLSGTPQQAGSFLFTARVTGADGLLATRSFTLQIDEAPQAPQITTTALPGGTLGVAYSVALQATGGVTPYSWSLATGSLPPGISLSAAGVLNGTPTTTGTSNLSIRVTGGDGLSSTQAFTLVVSGTPQPPTITTSSLPAATVGEPYSFTFQAAGGTPPYAWRVVQGQLPPGISLSLAGVLSGTPTVSGGGEFLVEVAGADTLTAGKGFFLAVNPAPQPPTILDSALPVGTVGVTYSATLQATGGVTPYSWSLASGALPTGLTLSASGVISGTPTVGGVFQFSPRVTGADGGSSTQLFAITVQAPPTITTSSLPAGQVSVAYSATLQATGGSPPYTWSIASGSLPPGLSLSTAGVLSGTPTTQGSFTFTVRATGTNGLASTRTYTLSIQAAPLVLGKGFAEGQFSYIKGGVFLMGSAKGEVNEQPVHEVRFSKDFLIQRTEVTQAQWVEVMQSNPSRFTACGELCPVEQVSWSDVQAFLKQLNAIDPGKNYRLPTEAQWEFAARAGSEGDYGGGGSLDDMGWYNQNSKGTVPVAQLKPNPWNLFDMHGNVAEWVSDWYLAGYYKESPTLDPQGPNSGEAKVARGGAWNLSAYDARSARRLFTSPSNRGSELGFRLVRDP